MTKNKYTESCEEAKSTLVTRGFTCLLTKHLQWWSLELTYMILKSKHELTQHIWSLLIVLLVLR